MDGLNRLMDINVVEPVTIGAIATRLYFYYSCTHDHEVSGDLAEIRRALFGLHKVAIWNHDELGQISLLVDRLLKKRKEKKIAPVAARRFRIQCNKWAVLVRLLLGEIPETTIFTQSGMQGALRPYFELTNAVRIGDLELFSDVSENICYSSISLDDVADELRMHSTNHVEDVENIVAKAISDGANEAKIDHANGWLTLKETGDIYSTAEPQAAFSSRIAFCLKLHNEAARAPHSMETSKSNTYGAQIALLAEENGKYL
ncbi:hypothetical protein Peur_051430 [Populus x canadensis]